MVLGKHICYGRVKLVTSLWLSTRGCGGHRVLLLNCMRYSTILIVAPHLVDLGCVQEIKPGMIELMKPKLSFAQSEIQDGDVICFQVDLPDKEYMTLIFTHYHTKQFDRIHDLESQGLHSNPAQYYDFLQNRVMIVFKPKFEEPNHDHPEFQLTLSKKQNYDTVRCRYLVLNTC